MTKLPYLAFSGNNFNIRVDLANKCVDLVDKRAGLIYINSPFYFSREIPNKFKN
jgi:hypothetical protein